VKALTDVEPVRHYRVLIPGRLNVRLVGSKGAFMKHMIPLLIGSFIVVNTVSGYLNPDPSMAGTPSGRVDAFKTLEKLPVRRVARPLVHGDYKD
jgi:hypothetical protein